MPLCLTGMAAYFGFHGEPRRPRRASSDQKQDIKAVELDRRGKKDVSEVPQENLL